MKADTDDEGKTERASIWAVVIVLILCTPVGWIGLLCLAAVFGVLLNGGCR